ncbi:MAG: hypothetical protein KatS3mg124_0062 [Porticoccaceae bacterium]|nr:MAG: hypothetical protein KatS3mg124_0062 [Porticoccaceae bacterium]
MTAGILVRRAPGAVMADLDRFIRAPGTHPMLRNHLVAWREGVADLARQRDLRSHPDPAALRALAARWLETTPNERLAHVYLPENARPRLLWLRAELSRAFEEEGDRRRAAEWLYLLAVADRLLEYRFFPLADLYLAECVLSYADTPAAPVCLREYEAYVEFFYTGTAGTAVPPEVAAQLARLRRHLEGARPRASQPASQGVRP